MKILYSIILTIVSLTLFGQSYSIEGYITDQQTEPLPSATVVVLSQIDSTMAGFALSTNDGRFIIRNIEKGVYLLQVSYLGYEQYSEQKSVTGANKKVDVKNIQLSLASNQIEEIVVKGETIPIEVKKDTIVYNANAFKTQPNDVVEDLLRQMPGIEVEEDGTIVAQGEEVQKVTVDGKDFFGNDPSIATKNLPAKAIDKVEFFDQKSDRAEFTGVDDGERTKTMNLELKEDYKKGFFGNVEVGAGYEHGEEETRFKLRGNVNRFSKKSQLSIIGNLNNINEQGFSTKEYYSFMSSIGGWGRGGGGQGKSGISMNQGLSDGYVDTGASGINFNYDLTPKTEISLSYFVNDIASNIFSQTNRETFINESRSFFSNDELDQISENRSHTINLRIEQEIDSTQDIRLNSSLNINDGNINSKELSANTNKEGSLANTGNTNYQSNANQMTPSGSLLYRKRLGSNVPWVVTLEGTLNQTDNDANGNLNSDNDFAPSDPNMDVRQILLQRQLESDDENSYRVDATLTQPLGSGQYLDYNYRRSNTSNDVVTDVYDIDNDMEVLNTILSTRYTRDYSYNRYGLAWQKEGDKSSLSLGTYLQQSQLDGELSDINSVIDNSNLAILPTARLRYEIDRGHNFSFRYRTSVNQPTIEQLQPVLDQTDPLNLYQGNPDLQVEYRHNLRMNYIKWDQFNFSSLFAFVTINYARNNIINQTSLDENFVQTTSPINVSDDLSIRTNLSYSRPLRSLGAKIKLFTNNTYQNSIQFINTAKNDVNRFNTSVGFTIENRNKDNFSISGTARLTQNTNIYSENTEQNLSYLNQSYRVGTRLDAINSWSFASDLDVRHYSEQNFSPAETIPIWTASISKYFLEGNKGEFRLSAHDLLNQNQSIIRTSNANYVQNETINTLGRYLMASFLYSFSSTSGKTGGGANKKIMRIH